MPQSSDDDSLRCVADVIHLEHLAAKLKVSAPDVILRQPSEAACRRFQKPRVLDLNSLRILCGEADSVHRIGDSHAPSLRPHR